VRRRPPLEDRRFRSLLLAIAGIPILLLYIWQSVVVPIAFGGYLGDLKESYLRAAGQLVAGRDEIWLPRRWRARGGVGRPPPQKTKRPARRAARS